MAGDPSGRTSPAFRADREKGMTQTTAGVNPNPPAQRSASVPADAPPMSAAACLLGPASGLDTGGVTDPMAGAGV
jgi:hypothetical protein